MHIDDADARTREVLDGYECLKKWAMPLKRMERALVGRDAEKRSLMAAFCRPEVSNVILLGEAGSGKTAIVQGAMADDESRIYLEIDIAQILADVGDPTRFGGAISRLFNEVMEAQSNIGPEIVLFIDEFHKIVQAAPSAVEDLKPLLADSGTRGVRVVAATTYTEFRQWVAPNQPLVERLQRINVSETDRKMTLRILRGMCERYGVDGLVPANILDSIYVYTNRYIPANSQPRKSILVLDAMVGWHRAAGKPFDRKLLADVIYESEGVRIDAYVDPTTVKEKLDEVVLSQEYATSVVASRMQLCLAGLNNPDAPQSTMLFTGSSGVGKTLLAKRLADILFGDTQDSFILFDMAEYSQESSVDQFRIELTNDVWAHPFSVILLDEIEKAAPNVSRLLLSVLDDGRLNDSNGRVVSFTNAHIILTTNVGHEFYKGIAAYEASDTGSAGLVEKYASIIEESLKSTSRSFPPELLGRIDEIVPFQPFSQATYDAIALTRLDEVRRMVYRKHGVRLTFNRRVGKYVTYDRAPLDADSGGARALNRVIEHEIVSPIATYINAHPNDLDVLVHVDGELKCENKRALTSNARIEVMSMQTARERNIQLV